ncbi:MAG TPA: protein kinase [Polyangia bacterium]|nr:protein kinase [Polyangia bacterium]
MDESCLGDDTLLDFVAGRLPDGRRETVERHLAGCAMCSRLVSAAVGSARETVRARQATRTLAPSRTVETSGDEAVPDEGAPRDLTDRLQPKAPSLAPGTLLAETYKIVRLIGSGGMGEVYEATHTRLTGRYAVKVLHRHWAGDPRAIVRFGREAQITSGLRHPNIVAIIDFDYTPAGSPYLVMEYIDGVELATVIAGQAPIAAERVVRIVDQIASALTAVHARNIVHRDLKPQNIFLVPGERPGDERVKLVDFGISKVRAASVALTGERAVLGTPQYMAPEQAQAAGEVDGRADQFALAAIVYEMLTGRMAFPGDRMEIVVYRISHEEPRPLGPAWGPALASVIMRALAKDPAGRFPSTDDFAAALRAAVESDRLTRTPISESRATQRRASSQDGTPSLAGLPAVGPETRERHASRRWTVVGGLGAAVALAAVLAVPLWRRSSRHDAAPATPAPLGESVPSQPPANREPPAPPPAANPAPAPEPAPPAPVPVIAASRPPSETPAAESRAPVAGGRSQRRAAARHRGATVREKDAAASATAPGAVAPAAAATPDAGSAATSTPPAPATRGSKMGSLIDRL